MKKTYLISALLLSACSTIYPTQKGMDSITDPDRSLVSILKKGCDTYTIDDKGFTCTLPVDCISYYNHNPDYAFCPPGPLMHISFKDIYEVTIEQSLIGGNISIYRSETELIPFHLNDYIGTEPPQEVIDSMNTLEILRRRHTHN